ncbi:MAG: HEAT repeat domain-containing protein [Planctomycetota bacterium]
MSDQLQLEFCDLCGLSIPLKDVEAGLIRKVEGKTLGACCLAKVLEGTEADKQAQGGAQVRRGDGVGLIFPTALLLVAVCLATAFVEWRAIERDNWNRRDMGDLATKVREASDNIEEIDAKVAAIPAAAMDTKLLALRQEANELRQALERLEPKDDTELRASMKEAGLRIQDLAGRLGGLESRLTALDRAVQGGFDRLQDGMRRLEEQAPATAGTTPVSPVKDTAERSGPTLDLPDDLAKEVAKLGDPEPGVRWAAIDVLLAKQDPRVVPHLLPTLADKDPFIRRLTANGLGKLGDVRAVWPLFDALSDEESFVRSAAYRSLVKLTSEEVKPQPFDPDASDSKRRGMLDKWRKLLEPKFPRGT